METKTIKNSGREMVIRKTATYKTTISPRTWPNTPTLSSAVMGSSLKVHNLVINDVNSSCGPSTSRGPRKSKNTLKEKTMYLEEEKTLYLEEVFEKCNRYLSSIEIPSAEEAQLPKNYKHISCTPSISRCSLRPNTLEEKTKHIDVVFEQFTKFLSPMEIFRAAAQLPKRRAAIPDPTIIHRIRRISLMTSEDRAAQENAPKKTSQKKIGTAPSISSPSPGAKARKLIHKKPTVKKQTSEKAPETQPNPLPEERHRKVVDCPKRKRFIQKEVRERAEERYAGSRLPGEIISIFSQGSKVSG